MLREFFGKTSAEVQDTFGKRASVTQAAPESPPVNATPDELTEFNRVTDSMTHVYATVDGKLVMHFNGNKQVQAITFIGQAVSPPAVAPPMPKQSDAAKRGRPSFERRPSCERRETSIAVAQNRNRRMSGK